MGQLECFEYSVENGKDRKYSLNICSKNESLGGDSLKAKQYLAQIEKLDAKIQNKMAEIEHWRAVALGITPSAEGERVQTSGSKQKMSDAIDRLVDIEKEIDRIVDDLVDTKQKIIRTIEQLSAIEYDVLHKRYIQGMTFDEIGAVKGKSKSWATTIHGRALQSLQKILDEREQAEQQQENL